MDAVEKEAGAAAAAIDDGVNTKGENVGKAAAADAPNDGVANGEAGATPEAATPALDDAVNTPKPPKFCANGVVAWGENGDGNAPVLAAGREDTPNNDDVNASAKSSPANAPKFIFFSMTFARNCIS